MTAPASQGYAGLVSRAGAFAVDTALVTVGTTAFVLFLELLELAVGTRAGQRGGSVPLLPVAVPALLLLYETVFWTLAGRTPGMALLGIRVVPVAGHRLSWAPALARAVVLTLFPVGAAWSLVDARRQAVHDKVARTVVRYTGHAIRQTR